MHSFTRPITFSAFFTCLILNLAASGCKGAEAKKDKAVPRPSEPTYQEKAQKEALYLSSTAELWLDSDPSNDPTDAIEGIAIGDTITLDSSFKIPEFADGTPSDTTLPAMTVLRVLGFAVGPSIKNSQKYILLGSSESPSPQDAFYHSAYAYQNTLLRKSDALRRLMQNVDNAFLTCENTADVGTKKRGELELSKPFVIAGDATFNGIVAGDSDVPLAESESSLPNGCEPPALYTSYPLAGRTIIPTCIEDEGQWLLARVEPKQDCVGAEASHLVVYIETKSMDEAIAASDKRRQDKEKQAAEELAKAARLREWEKTLNNLLADAEEALANGFTTKQLGDIKVDGIAHPFNDYFTFAASHVKDSVNGIWVIGKRQKDGTAVMVNPYSYSALDLNMNYSTWEDDGPENILVTRLGFLKEGEQWFLIFETSMVPETERNKYDQQYVKEAASKILAVRVNYYPEVGGILSDTNRGQPIESLNVKVKQVVSVIRVEELAEKEGDEADICLAVGTQIDNGNSSSQSAGMLYVGDRLKVLGFIGGKSVVVEYLPSKDRAAGSGGFPANSKLIVPARIIALQLEDAAGS